MDEQEKERLQYDENKMVNDAIEITEAENNESKEVGSCLINLFSFF